MSTAIETYPDLTRAAAARKLGEMGARHEPRYSTKAEQLYYAGRQKVWVRARRGSSRELVTLEIFKACPC